ncbi:MAG: M56 family metallopeptidase, partial [Bacteroidota bacterium]
MLNNPILIYLLEASLCLGLFYLLYCLFFARLKFYAWNRGFLLLTCVFSLLLPFLTFPPFFSEMSTYPSINHWLDVPAEATKSVPDSSPSKVKQTFAAYPKSTEVEAYFLVIYILGLIFFAGRFVRSIYRLIRLGQKGKKEEKFRLQDQQTGRGSASFFHYIFLATRNLSNQEAKLVLDHEKKHYALGHSWDLLFLGMYQIAFWFNPLVYLIRRSLRLVHEYQVDVRMLDCCSAQDYAALLLKLGSLPSLSFCHQVGQAPIKLRVFNLFQPYSHPMKKLLYLFSLPLIFIACQQFGDLASLERANLPTLPKAEELDSLRIYGAEFGPHPMIL